MDELNPSIPHASSNSYPYNRIQVFISSSMRDENDFSWKEFREKISRQFSDSPLFVPFKIEDHTSPEPSRNYYLHQVERSGIVVSLIREELRSGTEDEIRHSIDRKKPLLLILIGHKRDEATDKLIRQIENIDYATYVIKEPSSSDELSRYILEQLNRVAVDFFENKAMELQGRAADSIEVSDTIKYAIRRSSISAFGDSSTLLAKHYRYDIDYFKDFKDKNLNPYLEPLGRVVVKWLIEGSIFPLIQFIPTIQTAMKDSGLPDEMLKTRLHSLDAFISKDYSRAYSLARQARESLSDQESWLYGNCLIDARNLSQYAPDEEVDTFCSIQKEIDRLGVPVVFPLAAQYANKAFSQTLKTERKFRTLNPNSTIFDSTLAVVLNDLCIHAFVSILYGSVASFAYSRILIAHALLDYSEIYSDENLAFEGIKLLVLAGEAREFNSQFNIEKQGVSNALKSGSDDLWILSGKAIEAQIPAIRCALVQQAAPYFSDSTFQDVESFLSENSILFDRCRDNWIKAIDSIKLRMTETALVDLLVEIISNRLYATARPVGNIISGRNPESYSKENLARLSSALCTHAAELIKADMPLAAFAAVEKHANTVLVDSELLASVSSIECSAYLSCKTNDDSIKETCIDELKRKYEANNATGCYSHFGYEIAPTICAFLDQKHSLNLHVQLEKTLTSILETVNGYQGFPIALDGPLAVLCKYICVSRSNGTELPNDWIGCIKAIDENRFSSSSSNPVSQYDGKALRTRIHALRTAIGLEEGLSFLTEGISLENHSFVTKKIYLESLEWLLSSPSIPDSCSILAKRICCALSKAQQHQLRIKALRCLAVCSRRWGMEEIDGTISTLTRDSADTVVFQALNLCKKGAFDNPSFEERTIELLTNDSNWFIRWHALND